MQKEYKFSGLIGSIREFRKLLKTKYKVDVVTKVVEFKEFGLDKGYIIADIDVDVIDVINEVEWRGNLWNRRISCDIRKSSSIF